MNRCRCPKRWLSLWLIVAMLGHFGLAAGEVPAFLFCFGADGHVAVERTGHDHRSEAGPELQKAPLSEVAASTTKATGSLHRLPRGQRRPWGPQTTDRVERSITGLQGSRTGCAHHRIDPMRRNGRATDFLPDLPVVDPMNMPEFVDMTAIAYFPRRWTCR